MRLGLITVALLAAAASYMNASLITNASFETIPGPASGQGILPSGWMQLAGAPGADTYSVDGSFGLFPSTLGNFPGVTAYDGLRWVAGGSGGISIAPLPEVFGQLLGAPLIAGHIYTISAYLIAAQRTDISGAGAYQLSLAADPASLASAVLVGQFGAVSSTTAWQYREFIFTAPAGAAALPLLVFTPYASGAVTAYPGIDQVSLAESESGVPKPGTLALAGAGLIFLAATRRVWRNG